MAMSRALMCLIRQRNLLPCNRPMNLLKSKNVYLPLCVQQLTYAGQKLVAKSEQKDSEGQVQVGFAEVVKENTKSAWYLTVIVAGVAGTGAIFYAVFKELFSSKSPNGVYNNAFIRCVRDPKVCDAIGEPIKAFGEETRRGRRGHVQHSVYRGEDGVNRMRMKFYIQGSRKEGTVHLEMREDSDRNWVYRYLFIQLKDFTKSVIVLEDNRDVEHIVYQKEDDAHELIPPGLKM
ncbi:mitochondrial import inner membrane translocase subunit Tim21 [Copidosoma floridanum]|uniref:mitochondrial import inner membrane translocase subunit Tim21 n=1 Tax=Copidosoma floridanum TaxID=29053 RepID=UPI0006C93E65|nr:mitochondrial import inner membrane translocase subunit Tim21 [Copidosoma floridanum]